MCEIQVTFIEACSRLSKGGRLETLEDSTQPSREAAKEDQLTRGYL